jgi:hypothetical protein
MPEHGTRPLTNQFISKELGGTGGFLSCLSSELLKSVDPTAPTSFLATLSFLIRTPPLF